MNFPFTTTREPEQTKPRSVFTFFHQAHEDVSVREARASVLIDRAAAEAGNLLLMLAINATVFGFEPQNEFEHQIGTDPVAPPTIPVSRRIRYRRTAMKIKIQQEYTSGFPATSHFLASWRNRNAC
jgi:hypothetical protein